MLYYEEVLRDYDPYNSEDERRTILTKLSEIYSIEHLEKQMMILYRHICHKKVSYNILADVKWLLDR